MTLPGQFPKKFGSRSRPSGWPVRVKRGNSTVTIYKAYRKKNGRTYREFKLAYYDQTGKRKFQSFNSLTKARRAANNVNVSLIEGGGQGAGLKATTTR